MRNRLLAVLLILAIIACVVCAAVSVAMVIRAVQDSEWGRVVLYSVTTAFSVEMVVLAISKRKSKETA